MLVVDIVNGITTCSQSNLEGIGTNRNMRGGAHTTVDSLDIGLRGSIFTDAVKNTDKLGVALTIYLAQFDADELHLLPNLSREEIGRGIERLHQSPFVFLNHRFQLENIAHQQQLLTSKRFAHIATINA